MHPLDQFVSFDHYDQEISRLSKLLDSLEIQIPENADIKAQTLAAFAALYYSVFADERPLMTTAKEIETGAALAGLGDLAAKINRAARTEGFSEIRPHLAKMVEGSLLMNGRNDVTDEAGNKNSELYVGCLALGAGCEIQLEDPHGSDGGTNPDVLLQYKGEDWAIAVKTSHSATPQTIFGNIQKAVEQIERSGRQGLVFVNVKNLLDRQSLIDQSPFSSIDEAVQTVGAQIDKLTESLRNTIVRNDWIDAFRGKRARPLVAFMGQTTVSGDVVPGLQLFVPVKVIRPFLAPGVVEPEKFDVINSSAARLLNHLNHELQRNPGSAAEIGSFLM